MSNKKVLMVLTSHDKMGDTGKQTGYYLPELTHPFFRLKEAGFDVEIASIKGGEAPMDEGSRKLEDESNKRFMENPAYRGLIENTLELKNVNASDYDAIFFTGGHGTMWDFPTAEGVSEVSAAIYENGGVVAAVCHGPAALVNLKLSNGEYLVSGKKVTGFSNAEEEAAGLTKVMPFLLESELVERGAEYSNADLWQKNIVVDQRVITGQNPASAEGVGEAIIDLLSE